MGYLLQQPPSLRVFSRHSAYRWARATLEPKEPQGPVFVKTESVACVGGVITGCSGEVTPSAEVCDGVDNDCDGLSDDADSDVDSGTKTLYYADSDSDGYGNVASSLLACTQPDGYVANPNDCNDESSALSPATIWMPMQIRMDLVPMRLRQRWRLQPAGYVSNDSDCDDGDASEFPGQVWYQDSDSDSYGNLSVKQTSCLQPVGYVTNAADCNDENTSINPGETEVCDGADIDENCNSLADDDDATVSSGSKSTYYYDEDGDGYGGETTQTRCDPTAGYVALGGDCNEEDASLNPATTWFADGDGDDFGAGAVTHTQCSAPGAGYAIVAGDCDNTDSTVWPGAPELCDGQFNNCSDSSYASPGLPRMRPTMTVMVMSSAPSMRVAGMVASASWVVIVKTVMLA